MHKKTVIEHFGSIKVTAEKLKISHSSISQWDELIPELRAHQIERITKGVLKYDASLYQKPT